MKYVYTLLLVSLYLSSWAQSEEGYHYKINLNQNRDDELRVELLVPSETHKENELFFHIPKYTPYIYQALKYGFFIHNLEAFDKKGNPIQVTRVNKTTWQIHKHKRLHRIVYEVADNWDTQMSNSIPLSWGTNFARRVHYQLQPAACLGYFANLTDLPITLQLDRPAALRAATGLERTGGGDFDTEVFKATNYFELLERPIVYTTSDSVAFQVGDTKFLLHLYDPHDKSSLKKMLNIVRPVVEQSICYYEGMYAYDRYVIHINLLSAQEYPKAKIPSAAGFQNSGIVTAASDVGEVDWIAAVSDMMSQSILTHQLMTDAYVDFDYQNPTYTRHLWLYEGVRAYFDLHMRLSEAWMTTTDFALTVQQKMREMDKYQNGYSLIELSEKAATEKKYMREIPSIYSRGLLTAFCWDAHLLYSSRGNAGLREAFLSWMRYAFEGGVPTGLPDEELLKDFSSHLPLRASRDFIPQYIEGVKILPLVKDLRSIGFLYQEEGKEEALSFFGGIDNGVLSLDSTKHFFIYHYDRLDDFGKKHIQFQKGDIVVAWNGIQLTAANVSRVLLEYANHAKPGDPLKVTVKRAMPDGSEKVEELEAIIQKVLLPKKHVLRPMESPNQQQKGLQQRWLRR